MSDTVVLTNIFQGYVEHFAASETCLLCHTEEDHLTEEIVGDSEHAYNKARSQAIQIAADHGGGIVIVNKLVRVSLLVKGT